MIASTFTPARSASSAVAITPGEGFDAPGFFRLSYATSTERLREGVDRMFAFVAAMEKSGKIPAAANK